MDVKRYFCLGINAGIYAGTYGSNGLLGPNGPYGGINNNIGGSYGGLSSWPVVNPWIPQPATLIPPLLPPRPGNYQNTTWTTSRPTVNETRGNPISNLIPMPIDAVRPDELRLPQQFSNKK